MDSNSEQSDSQSLEGLTGTTNSSSASFLVASSLSELEHLIDNCPIIDNHAHPLLTRQTLGAYEASGLDLLKCLSEANDDALKDVPNTLAYHRAFKSLQQGFSHLRRDEIRNWEDWKNFRAAANQESFTKECFSGLQTILIDHGLRYPKNVEAHSVEWHSQFLKSPAKGIVRLENVAEELMKVKGSFQAWDDALTATIRTLIRDDENTVGFKSVICYRIGLDFDEIDLSSSAALQGFEEIHFDSTEEGWRLVHTVLNTYVISLFAREMTKHVEAGGRPKPLQLHTGLGDSDLRLKTANPVLLQSFMARYPLVPFVILHAGYPYTREAGYLASTYSNVYLDFGLVFPMISQEGQESVVKQVLELTPSSKAMWSTDGHHYGETYYLAIKQMREVFKTVMREICEKDNIDVETVSKIVTDILFNTSNQLYGLKLDLHILPPSDSTQETAVKRGIAGTEDDTEHNGRAGLKILRKFLSQHPGIEYLRLNWLDYSSILRTRVVKLKQAIAQLEKNSDGSILGITKASLYILANCTMADGASPCGEDRLVPDFKSIRLHPHKRDGASFPNHATVMCWIQDEDTHRPIPLCPRNILKNSLSRASDVNLSGFKIGFEIEFCIFKQLDLDEGRIVPISAYHTWTTSRSLQTKALDILEEIDQKLSAAGIEIEQFHSEAAQGQYEIALSPLPPMLAVDTLVHTREIIQWVCAKHGYRASLLPKPFDNQCGTASHVHMSFKPVEKQWNFFAGVLEEFKAVSAVTLGSEMSYERVIPGCWAGGTWACWGRQNREAPLRLVEEDKAHWEIKAVDGMANMYLAIAGIIIAGTIGVGECIEIYGESDGDASQMTAEERHKQGIKTPMTKSMDEAVAALFEKDGETPTWFSEEIAPGFAQHLAAVKKAEKDLVYSQFVDPQTGAIEVTRRRAWAAQWY